MTTETSDSISKPTETKLHHRRNKTKSSNSVSSSSKESAPRQSLAQWLASYFTDRSSKKIDNDQKNKCKPRSRINSCFCQHLFLKLILFFGAFYLTLFFRPDYAIYLRNSFEGVLKKFNLTSQEYQLRPGQRLADYRQPSMPIIIIPGIISTGLELWKGTECASGKFRHRFWTSMQMVDNIGRDHQCWLKHISLNLSTW
jgi:hypothetical protein